MLFVPLEQHPLLRDTNTATNARLDRSKEWVLIHGRLSPGLSLGQASAAVSAVTSRLAKQYPATNEFKAGIADAYSAIGGLGRSQVLIIQAVGLTLTGTVLVVVCLNISGMMLVRGAMRERELSIRQAIGATRGRLAYVVGAAIAVLVAVVASIVPARRAASVHPMVGHAVDMGRVSTL